MKMTLAEVARVVGGSLADPAEPRSNDIVVTGACADSRRAQPGDVYVAIVGERADGHDFAASAIQAGAVAVLGSRATAFPTIIVDDPVAALGKLAHHHIASLPDLTVIAITGSSGKTTTKDLIGDVLAKAGPTVAPAGSFNTEVGLPLTALTADESTRFLVLEMGARGVGHIATLCAIAQPQISAVLNVGSAHIGEFGGREMIAAAKSEIVAGPSVQVAILNADDPYVCAMADVTNGAPLMFGEGSRANVRATDVVLDDTARAHFTLTTPSGSAQIDLNLVGEHMVSNSLAAASVGHAVGLSAGDIAEALNAAKPKSRWRMEITTTTSGITVINDAYNANPESMRAALKALTARRGGGRSWAVLGEMKELGEVSLHEHDDLGRLAVRLDVSRLIAVGEGARPIHLGATQEGSWGNESVWVPDPASAIDLLTAELQPGDVVLVKASRSVGLEVVADALIGGATQ